MRTTPPPPSPRRPSPSQLGLMTGASNMLPLWMPRAAVKKTSKTAPKTASKTASKTSKTSSKTPWIPSRGSRPPRSRLALGSSPAQGNSCLPVIQQLLRRVAQKSAAPLWRDLFLPSSSLISGPFHPGISAHAQLKSR